MTRVARNTLTFCAAVALCGAALSSRADLVVMQNGDRYNGKVLSVTTNTLVLQSDVLGIVASGTADLYLSLLGRFLQDTTSSKNATTNPPASSLKP